jgi:prolyl-tRNA synthetase
MFNVKFKTENETEDFAWQTSWGLSTRVIGAVIMTHGDDKGVVWPPKIAPIQVVAVPIFSSIDEKKTALLALGRVVEPLLHKGIRVFVDAREGKTPGFKFNEWELKGVPLRIEVGMKDLAKQGFTLARRDTGEKEFYSEEKTVETILKLLEEIQANLLAKAKSALEKNTSHVDTIEQLKQAVEKGGFAVAGWCADARCEEAIKEETQADIRLIPFDAHAKGKCVYCGSTAKTTAYFARAY